MRKHQHPQTATTMSNVGNKIISNDQIYNQYKQQQQMQHQPQIIPDLDNFFRILQEQKPASAPLKDLAAKQDKQITNEDVGKKAFKRNNARQKKSHAASLASVGILRKYDTVNIDGCSRTQKVLMPLDEKTKYRDQWKKQPSDELTDDQRTTINIGISKSVRTKMRNHAKQFCTTNNAVEELQRGSLVYIFAMLIEQLNPFSTKLFRVNPLAVSNAFVLLTRVVPQSLLQKVFTHLFRSQASLREDSSPSSKKKIPSIEDLITGKESYNVFRLVNEWLMNQLPAKQAAQELTNNGSELPLQCCVRVLNESRADIVIMLKQLEEKQCQMDAITTYKKMVDHVQAETENIATKLVTQSAKTKLVQNVNAISRLSFSLSRQEQHQKQTLNLKRKISQVSNSEEEEIHEKIRKLRESVAEKQKQRRRTKLLESKTLGSNDTLKFPIAKKDINNINNNKSTCDDSSSDGEYVTSD